MANTKIGDKFKAGDIVKYHKDYPHLYCIIGLILEDRRILVLQGQHRGMISVPISYGINTYNHYWTLISSNNDVELAKLLYT